MHRSHSASDVSLPVKIIAGGIGSASEVVWNRFRSALIRLPHSVHGLPTRFFRTQSPNRKEHEQDQENRWENRL